MVRELPHPVYAARSPAGPPVQGQNFGKYVNASACSGTLVINVTSAVTKDADSGFVLARYEGQFATVADSSPAGTFTVAAGRTGTTTGGLGYQYTFDGVVNPSPAHATTGHIGSFDYGWDGTQAGAGVVRISVSVPARADDRLPGPVLLPPADPGCAAALGVDRDRAGRLMRPLHARLDRDPPAGGGQRQRYGGAWPAFAAASSISRSMDAVVHGARVPAAVLIALRPLM